MVTFSELGIQEGSFVSDDMISTVESELKCKFPDLYKQLVKYCDEPMPEVNVFQYEEGETCISEFLKFTDNKNEEYGILSYRAKNLGLSGNYIPFARDAGDFLICFDFSKEIGEIVLFDIKDMKIFKISESFEKFIECLQD